MNEKLCYDMNQKCAKLFILHPQIRFAGWKLELGIWNWEQGTGTATVP